MKFRFSIVTFILIIGLSACNNYANKEKKQKSKSNCYSHHSINELYKIAKSQIKKHNNNQIWNLYQIDTTKYFATVDNFINSTSKNKLVLFEGKAGLSAGNAKNMLIIFSCSDTLKVVWSGQVDDFTKKDILDIDNDGIKEIITNPNSIWMGQCFESYNIFNLKGGKRNYIFKRKSMSLFDCGYPEENTVKLFQSIDTVVNNFKCSLLRQNNKYVIRQIHTIKIYDGGQTYKEAVNNLHTEIDTTMIEM